ncbi:MAG: tetratricopeptide repeat protein, partial [Bacteroidales bacterium]|nr:tetratricopeptide repeat protein [Bacteroidales bacterium]
MNFRLLLLFSFFGFVIIGESQTENKVDKQFSEADYLFENQKYKEAYFAYQTIEKQKTELDSLEKGKLYLGLCACAEKLENFPEAIAFHMQARQFVPFTNQKENQYYIDRVESVLPTETDSLSLSRLYYRFAVLLVKEGNREASFPYFFKALDLAKGLKHYAAVATIANDIAGEYWDVGNGLLSTKMYEEAVSAAIRSGDSNRIAGAYLNLAGNYTDQGDFQTGIKIHLKALSIKEKIADSSRLSYYYQSAASIYYELRDYKNWEEYAQKAYQLNRYEYARSLLDKASVYGILGGIANRKNQVNTALRYYDTLLILSKEIASENGQKTALDNQSKIYKEQGKYDVALELLTQSEAFLTDNPYYHISHRNTKAELYQSLKKPKEALQLLLLNTKESSLNNYSFEKLRTFRLLYEVNTQLAAYQEAFRWNDSLRLLENMLRDADVRKDIAELETQYQTEKKEQQISLLTAENELKNQRMQQAFLLIGFLLVLVSLILFLLYFRRKQAAFKQSELQQQLLRSQMNPHFIFNVMGSIQ